MTEQEWLEGTDPKPLLKHVESGASDRQKRLFALACCRDILPRISDLDQQWTFSSAIADTESHVDGKVNDVILGAAVSSVHRRQRKGDNYARAIYDAIRYRRGEAYHGARMAFEQIAWAIADEIAPDRNATECSYFVGGKLVTESPPPNKDRLLYRAVIAVQHQWTCFLLRDIFGNPFQPLNLDPKWRSEAVVSLARRMYESREFADMPSLATALQESGCRDGELLTHCKSGLPHVRGCWAVDWILNKR